MNKLKHFCFFNFCKIILCKVERTLDFFVRNARLFLFVVYHRRISFFLASSLIFLGRYSIGKMPKLVLFLVHYKAATTFSSANVNSTSIKLSMRENKHPLFVCIVIWNIKAKQ